MNDADRLRTLHPVGVAPSWRLGSLILDLGGPCDEAESETGSRRLGLGMA